jgi:hypothetical protein
MRNFWLNRTKDTSGISGEGRVAQGTEFDNGLVAMTWLTEHTSISFYNSIEDVQYIHGQNGTTSIEWEDNKITTYEIKHRG